LGANGTYREKFYEKPTLNRREKLSAVAAAICAVSQHCGK
jgi:hypothetical protein